MLLLQKLINDDVMRYLPISLKKKEEEKKPDIYIQFHSVAALVSEAISNTLKE